MESGLAERWCEPALDPDGRRDPTRALGAAGTATRDQNGAAAAAAAVAAAAGLFPDAGEQVPGPFRMKPWSSMELENISAGSDLSDLLGLDTAAPGDPGSRNQGSMPGIERTFIPGFAPSDAQPPQHSPADSRMPSHPPAQAPVSTEDSRAALQEAVRCAFSLVDDVPEHRWARDFLLEHSLRETAQMVINPVALANSVATDMSGTLVETDESFNGSFDARIDLSGLFVPVFSSGDLTVGATSNFFTANMGSVLHNISLQGIVQAFSDSSLRELAEAESVFTLGRYACDTRRGRLLIVKHGNLSKWQPSLTTKVIYVENLSSTKAKKVNLTCDGGVFRSGKIIESVRCCITTIESRFCPFCSAPPNAGCQCKTPSFVPKHSLDFSAHPEAMKGFAGEFLGTTKALMAIPGDSISVANSSGARSRYISASLVSNFRLGAFDRSHVRYHDMSSMLQAFAVQLSISDISPAHVVMPTANVGGSSAPDVRTGFLHENSEDLDLSLGAVVTSSTPFLDSTTLPVDLLASFGVGPGEPAERVAQTGTVTLMGPNVDSSGACMELLTEANGSPDVSENLELPRELIEGSFATPCEGPMQRRPVVNDEKTSREALRRERNRQAAARSNARRKLRNDGLKNGLKETARRLEVLRLRESGLREENLELKRRLYEAKSESERA